MTTRRSYLVGTSPIRFGLHHLGRPLVRLTLQRALELQLGEMVLLLPPLVHTVPRGMRRSTLLGLRETFPALGS